MKHWYRWNPYGATHVGSLALSPGALVLKCLRSQVKLSLWITSLRSLPLAGHPEDLYGRLCTRGQVVPLSAFAAEAWLPALQSHLYTRDNGGCAGIKDLQQKVRQDFYL